MSELDDYLQDPEADMQKQRYFFWTIICCFICMISLVPFLFILAAHIGAML